jgi:hypothetical protein
MRHFLIRFIIILYKTLFSQHEKQLILPKQQASYKVHFNIQLNRSENYGTLITILFFFLSKYPPRNLIHGPSMIRISFRVGSGLADFHCEYFGKYEVISVAES